MPIEITNIIDLQLTVSITVGVVLGISTFQILSKLLSELSGHVLKNLLKKAGVWLANVDFEIETIGSNEYGRKTGPTEVSYFLDKGVGHDLQFKVKPTKRWFIPENLLLDKEYRVQIHEPEGFLKISQTPVPGTKRLFELKQQKIDFWAARAFKRTIQFTKDGGLSFVVTVRILFEKKIYEKQIRIKNNIKT